MECKVVYLKRKKLDSLGCVITGPGSVVGALVVATVKTEGTDLKLQNGK